MAVALYARVSTPRQAEKDLSIPCRSPTSTSSPARLGPMIGARCSSK